MSRYDENSNTELKQKMLTVEGRVLCGNSLQRFGSGLEPDPEPKRDFGPIAHTMRIPKQIV